METLPGIETEVVRSSCGDPTPIPSPTPTPTPGAKCHDGSSPVNGKCVGGDRMTLDIRPPNEGSIWYFWYFPQIGRVNNGVLTKIFNPNPNILSIIKIGHGSADCHNPNAVLVLNSGSSTEDMQSIFNTRTPSLPIWISSCLVSGEASGTISLVLTYTYQPS